MLKIIVVGKAGEFSSLVDGYMQRLRKSELVEVRDNNEILPKIKDEFVIVCDEKGKQMGSGEFAELLKEKENNGIKVVFVVGEAHGLSSEVRERADLLLSFSKMTFTYQMSRLVLLEQIYRAFCANKGIDYQK